MKKKTVALLMTAAMTVAALGGCGDADNAGVNVSSGTEESTAGTTETDAADGAVYKVGIVQFVDDASLNQIEASIEKELDAKAAELGVTFNYGHAYIKPFPFINGLFQRLVNF